MRVRALVRQVRICWGVVVAWLRILRWIISRMVILRMWFECVVSRV